MEPGAEAAAVLDVHGEEAELAGPLGIDEVAVGGAGECGEGRPGLDSRTAGAMNYLSR